MRSNSGTLCTGILSIWALDSTVTTRPASAYMVGARRPATSTSSRRILVLIESVSVAAKVRSEEHTSELQSRPHLVCRLLLEKKKTTLTTKCTENFAEFRRQIPDYVARA